MPTRAERRAYWRGHIERHAASGLSAKAYARQHGFAVANLYAARKRLGASSPRSQARDNSQGGAHFARVVPAPSSVPAAVQRIGCRLHLPGGCLLELDLPADGLAPLLSMLAPAR